MKFLYLLALATATLGITACGSDDKSSGPVSRMVVMGDPLNLIAGSTRNRAVDFEFFRGVSEVHLISGLSFEEKAKVKAEGQRFNVDEDNRTSKFMVKSDVRSLTFQRSGMQIVFAEDAVGTSVTFVSGFSRQRASLEHFSVSADGHLVSFLFSAYDTDSGRILMGLTFATKWNARSVSRTSTKYAYLMGDGEKLGWRKNSTVNLDACGVSDPEIRQVVSESVDEWKQALGARLNVNLAFKDEYAPFSDLNQRCIYYVNNYFTSADRRRANYGITYTIPDLNVPAISDSDVFVVAKEFTKQKMSPSTYAHKFRYTVLHELGHFFGLGHKFDGTDSIMSYNIELTPRLYVYDVEAIQELYR